MPPFMKEITEKMIRNLINEGYEFKMVPHMGTTRKGNKYPPEVREFAMGVEFYSPQVYNFIWAK